MMRMIALILAIKMRKTIMRMIMMRTTTTTMTKKNMASAHIPVMRKKTMIRKNMAAVRDVRQAEAIPIVVHPIVAVPDSRVLPTVEVPPGAVPVAVAVQAAAVPAEVVPAAVVPAEAAPTGVVPARAIPPGEGSLLWIPNSVVVSPAKADVHIMKKEVIMVTTTEVAAAVATVARVAAVLAVPRPGAVRAKALPAGAVQVHREQAEVVVSNAIPADSSPAVVDDLVMAAVRAAAAAVHAEDKRPQANRVTRSYLPIYN